MTAFDRYAKASLALVLLCGLATGCATSSGSTVSLTGEPIPAQVCGGDADSDGDGVTECYDRCPGTLRGESVDPEGCPLPPVVVPKPFRG
jgi:hypothetical protein